MSRFVVLTESPSATPTDYTVRLGPLAFVTPADTVSETIGDGLDAVGAALVATDRRPRPIKLTLPIRGAREYDADERGRVLRRQVRALLNNNRWRLSGLYFLWDADPDLDGWLLIGGADIGEAQPGVAFGEFTMDLSDVYIVGRPGTHRPGRRAQIGDRRTGLVALDTRRLLYSTDYAAIALPADPIMLPGDIVDAVASGNRPIGSVVPGPLRGARRLWRAVSGSDAEILTYLPDESIIAGRDRYVALDDLGSVRVWNLDEATTWPPDPTGYTDVRDATPDLYYGWTRVYGDLLDASTRIGVDNGVCRLIWLGPAAGQGVALEYWDDTEGHYVRLGRFLHSLGVRESRIVEVSPERAVIEWRAGPNAMRAILQRGWHGPRLESYNDGGGDAALEFAPEGASSVTLAAGGAANTATIQGGANGDVFWAFGNLDESDSLAPTVITGPAFHTDRTRVLVAQVGTPATSGAATGSLSLVDARPVPVLVGRQ